MARDPSATSPAEGPPMPEPSPVSPIEALVLVRLLAAGGQGMTIPAVRKDLEPLAGHCWPGNVLTGIIERTLIKLAAAGLALQQPGRTRKAAAQARLTPRGTEQALALLGLEKLPTKPKPTWPNLKKTWLVARALDLPTPAESFGRDPALKAALLRVHFDLPLAAYPELKAARNELTRKLLGMGAKEKITLDTVQAALFGRELGPDRPADPKRSLDRLLARQAGSRRDDGKDLRDAVLRGWIARSIAPEGREAPAPGPAHSPAPLPPAPLDLEALTRKVLAAARGCTTGRYGADKVFVVHVWRALQADPEFHALDFPTFKQRLAEANNARLLDLSRADLVQAMDPEDVALSEVPYLNTCFHFVRIPPGRP